MAEEYIVGKGSKEEQYRALIPQIKALMDGETDLIANLANVTAVLKAQFDFFWVGFYLVRNGELVLGPFQGPVACTRISRGKGVCGTAWERGSTLIVPDVDKFPGHIACSSLSRSEIVLPVFAGGAIVGVLDVDSDQLETFDQIDAEYLRLIVEAVPIPSVMPT